MVGWSETFEVLPAILVVGVSFSVTQYLWSNHVDSNLVDIAGGVISLVATVLFLRFWQPKRIWRLEHERAATAAVPGVRRHTAAQILKAWMPFAILSVFVLVWGLPADRKSTRLNSSHLVISYAVFCLKKKKKDRL